ncbi:SctK family type III secretion system sorting platform protein [Telmatospirillum sp. J64-1]|uniref:SctK family type III secretion system sorting platform protein n=1 Tax=Telmatospirillum sp. J64-1 TaxID=2502183 RepID=UPI00163DCD25|nr:SctK family type III secretion system sorting platform protein [Telmatospirillum sp. J64-1]
MSRLAAMMAARDPLFRLIYQFNLFPSRYIHASWVDVMFEPSLWQRMAATRRCEAALNRVLLQELSLEDSFPVDFSAPAARVGLLDQESLSRLSLYLGLTLDHSSIRRVIHGPSVAVLRQTLGDDAFLFAVQRAPLLAPPPGLLSPSLLPESDPSDEPGAMLGRFQAIGRRVLAIALGGLPPDILKRFRLKLPYDPDMDFSASDASPQTQVLLNRVLKETEPQWAFLFAPTTA